MAFFIGLNRMKIYQTAAFVCLIPTCIGLNMLGHFNLEEVVFASLVGTVKNL